MQGFFFKFCFAKVDTPYFVIIVPLCNTCHPLKRLLVKILVNTCHILQQLFVTLCNNCHIQQYLSDFETQDQGSRIQSPSNKTRDPRFRTQGSSSGTQDQITRFKNPDPGSEICKQGLGFILHIAWKFFFARMLFVIWEYPLQI